MTWAGFWSFLFFAVAAAFALVSIWVAVQGALDIRQMLRSIREAHERGEEDVGKGP
jgi:hypothetical protein